ncbi:MAG: ABC transporter permease [Pirellulales bacterium]|nr:ABC transporter permease [Pirellulales bacterium]
MSQASSAPAVWQSMTHGVTAYVGELWSCRYFWLSLVGMDLRSKYRRSVLGLGWSLLQPVAMAAVMCLAFKNLLQMDAWGYGMFLLAGLCFWNFFHGVASLGCNCMFQGEAYIRQHPAPVAIYPLRTVLGGSFHFLIALIFLIVVNWCLKGFDNLSALPSLLPTIVLIIALGWAVATLLGLANVYFHDTQHLLEVVLQMMFYATPIVYPPKTLENSGAAWLLKVNPLASFVNLVRMPVLEAQVPPLSAYLTAGGFALVLVVLAGWALARLEKRLIFHL